MAALASYRSVFTHPGFWLGIVLGAIVAFWGARSVLSSAAAPPTIDSNQQLITESGDTTSLQAVTQDKAFVYYFGLWCDRCLDHLPELETFAARHNIPLYLIADDPAEMLDNWRNKQSPDIRVLRSVRPLREAGVRSVPLTYLYDQRGEIAFSYVGAYNWERKGLTVLENIP